MQGAVNRRRAVRFAAVAGVGALVIGFFQAQGSASDDQDVNRTVVYQCGFSAGSRAVEVGFAGVFPVAGEAGRPFAPGDMTARVTLPQDVAGELLAPGAETFGSEATLTTPVSQNGGATSAQWPALSAEQAAVPAAGEDLSLTYQGTGPEITPAVAGDVTFSAGDLVLTFQADGAESPSRVECAPAPELAEEELTLATVEVSGGEDAEATEEEESAPEVEGQAREGAENPEAEAPADEVRPLAADCPDIPPSTPMDFSMLPRGVPDPAPGDYLDGSTGCTYAVGFADVTKQNGATIVNDPSGNPVRAASWPAGRSGAGTTSSPRRRWSSSTSRRRVPRSSASASPP